MSDDVYDMDQETEIELFEEGWDAAFEYDDIDDFHDSIGFGDGDDE